MEKTPKFIFTKMFSATSDKNRTLKIYETKTLYKYQIIGVLGQVEKSGKYKKKEISVSEIASELGFAKH